jgi:hypothetical protein
MTEGEFRVWGFASQHASSRRVYSHSQLNCPLLMYFVTGVFFSRLGTNIFKMIINLPICTEPKKIYMTKYDHQIRKKHGCRSNWLSGPEPSQSTHEWRFFGIRGLWAL